VINRIIEYSARNIFIILLFYLLIAGWGVWALYNTPVDAIPDISDNQVIVLTEWPGRSPQVIEDQITYPLASNLQGLPDVRAVRASSAFGYSMIYVIFEDNVDVYWARTRVLERLNFAASLLPPGVTPTLGPDGTGVGHVFWYTVEGDGYDLAQLRSIQDWFIRYQLNSVPGVAEVASVGGFVKEYQVDLNPNKLIGYHVTTKQVVDAIKMSNNEVGGNLIDQNQMSFMVRGLGYIKGIKDLEDIEVGEYNNTPIFVKDVGRVQMGVQTRRGILDKNGEGEAVGGIIVMRYGENAKDVIDRVKIKIAELSRGLPPGVRIVPSYDRSELIEGAEHTLKHVLIEEAIIVSIVILVFLLHLRSAFVVVISIPVAVLMSFIFMKHYGITSNIMSLAGIAIAIGVLIDAAIVMVENAYRHLSEGGEGARQNVTDTIIESAKQVGRPIFFSLVIIILSFAPVFLLPGAAGKMFSPLAYTKTSAMAAAAVLAVTLVPALMVIFLRGHLKPEHKNPVSRFFIALYTPVLAVAMRFKKTLILISIIIMVLTAALGSTIGKEFMPSLDEGSLLFMPVTLPAVSTTEAKRLLTIQDRIIMTVPEVKHVLGKIGRAETATDPAPVSMFETLILLKPKDQWRPGITKTDIQAELSEKLKMPGVTEGWTQPIINRIQMLATGVRTDLGVKILGNNLETLNKLAQDAERILRKIPGAVDLYAERVVGGKFLDIEVDREAAARYGLRVADVQDIIETAIGGTALTTTVEGRERFPVRIRYARDFRDDIETLKRVRVPVGTKLHVPLAQLATIKITPGPDMINSENSLLRSIVFLNVRGRDMGGFVDEAKKKLEEELKLPPGYYVTWSGQYENQIKANNRLKVLIPTVVLIIFILLYFTFRSITDSLTVMLSVLFSLVGGVVYLYLNHYYYSTAVWVGFIALYGIAVETGVVMMIYLNEAVDRRLSASGGAITMDELHEAVHEGAVLRLRPKLMTVFAAIMGLIPIMLSNGTGSDVMKPIATPMVGGLVTSTIGVLIMIPVIFSMIRERRLKKGTLKPSNISH
jgi:copper/silver efflux system protein